MSLMLLLAAAAQATVEPPKNLSPPSIGGTPKQGVSLKAKKGEWSGGGGLVYSYQWQRCEPECTNIVTATGSSYELRYVDIGARLRVIVTATNSAGSAEAISEPTAVVVPETPKNISLPVISGSAEEGQLLSASVGEWGGTPANSYAYEWDRCNEEGKACVAIEGATESTYRLVAADVGHKVRAVVTAIVSIVEPHLERSATSAFTATVQYGPPVALDEPSISGSLRVGGTLHVATGTWRGRSPITYSYRWESCSAEGSCATVGEGSSYAVAGGDVGHTLRVGLTATNEPAGEPVHTTTHSVPTVPVLGSGEHEDFVVGWGEDYRGQLGTIYRTNWEDNPVLAEGVTGVQSLAAGASGVFALHEDGTITASGAGQNGTIGYGGRKASWEQGKSHVTVKGITGAVQVSAGNESGAALLSDGTVMDWGANGYGILGNGVGGFEHETGESDLEPKEAKSLKGAGVTDLVAGYGDRFALLPGGEVDAWGYNRWGQLGVGWTPSCEAQSTCEEEFGTNKTKPKRLLSSEPVHKCYVETGWELCLKSPAPVLYGGVQMEHVKQIAAGAESTYALLESGEVLSWGSDGKGQLGQELEPGVHTSFTAPGKVMVGVGEPLRNVIAISAGRQYVLALVREGEHVRLYGWGNDTFGELGVAGETCGKLSKRGTGKLWPCDRWAKPVSEPEGAEIRQLAAGSTAAAVLGSDGKVYTVGSNAQGQLGRGPGCELGGGEMALYEACYSNVWKAVPGIEGAKAIAAGALDMVAVLSPGNAQPLPVVGYQPGVQTMELGWGLPDGESAESVIYRKWEHPGELEVAEEEGGEGGEGGGEEEAPEEGTGEAPSNEVLPYILGYEVVEGVRKRAKLELQVGDVLVASPGTWKGTPPIAYSYTWLRCKSSCSPIGGVGGSGEKANEYVLGEEDAGTSIEVQVTGRNGVEPHATVPSAPTEMIKEEEQGRNAKASRVKVEGLDGVSLSSLVEPQYEVKLNTTGTRHGGKTRLMVLSPQH